MVRLVGWLAVALAVAGLAGPAPARAASAEQGVEIVIEPPAEDGPLANPEQLPAAGSPDGKGEAVAAKTAAAEGAGDKLERMKATFAAFCETWFEKLRERERYNLSKVKWETAPDGVVVGEYVGYDTKAPGPQTVTGVEKTPIGKVVYMEYRLRRTGKSKDEALAAEPEIVERTEVTEIFRFERGAWVY
jgi:hypothetical protein